MDVAMLLANIIPDIVITNNKGSPQNKGMQNGECRMENGKNIETFNNSQFLILNSQFLIEEDITFEELLAQILLQNAEHKMENEEITASDKKIGIIELIDEITELIDELVTEKLPNTEHRTMNNELNELIDELLKLQQMITQLMEYSGQQAPVNSEHAIVNNQHAIANNQHAIVNSEYTIANNQHAIVNGEHAIVNGEHAIVNGEHAIANSQQAIITSYQLPLTNYQLDNKVITDGDKIAKENNIKFDVKVNIDDEGAYQEKIVAVKPHKVEVTKDNSIINGKIIKLVDEIKVKINQIVNNKNINNEIIVKQIIEQIEKIIREVEGEWRTQNAEYRMQKLEGGYHISTTNHKPPTTNHQLQITNHESLITNHPSRITNHRNIVPQFTEQKEEINQLFTVQRVDNQQSIFNPHPPEVSETMHNSPLTNLDNENMNQLLQRLQISNDKEEANANIVNVSTSRIININNVDQKLEIINIPQFVEQDKIIDEVVKYAKVMLKEDHNEIVMRLKPERLGELHLRIIQEQNVVRIEIQTTSNEVKNMLQYNLFTLKEKLESANIKVAELNINLREDLTSGAFSQTQNNHQQVKENPDWYYLPNYSGDDNVGISLIDETRIHQLGYNTKVNYLV